MQTPEYVHTPMYTKEEIWDEQKGIYIRTTVFEDGFTLVELIPAALIREPIEV